MASRTDNIPLSKIKANPAALREANTENPNFIALVDSIKQVGVLNAITVRELKDDATGETVYGLVDGLQRTTASRLAGKQTIPAHIMDLDEAQTLEAQIIANATRVETRPIEYTKALQRILTIDPNLTMSALATRLAKTPSWLSQRLNLLKLDEKYHTLVNEGKMTLANAMVLSKLPVVQQEDYVERAMTQPPTQFTGLVQEVIKQNKQKQREGGTVKTGFVASPHFRKINELKDVIENNAPAQELIKHTNTNSPVAAFVLALQWVLQLDPISLAKAEAEYNEQVAAREKAKEERKAERNKQKEAEARAAIAAN